MNQGCTYRTTIPPLADGRPLLDHLAEQFPHSTRECWRERVESGQLELDGRPAHIDSRLRRGQRLSWMRPPWREPPVPADLDLLFDDGDVLAVAKPAGLPTLPGAGYLEHTALARVRRFAPDAAPLHRLGRWTSGILLMAREATTRAELSRRWGAVEKRYRALASGRPAQREFDVRQPIGPLRHRRLGSIHAASPGGRDAHSSVRLIEQRDGAFLCDVRITTGRPHQIRIHLAWAGHPLVGDPLYRRGGIADDDALPGEPGYLLHAHSLEFCHPTRPGRLRLHCPTPVGALRASGGD